MKLAVALSSSSLWSGRGHLEAASVSSEEHTAFACASTKTRCLALGQQRVDSILAELVLIPSLRSLVSLSRSISVIRV